MIGHSYVGIRNRTVTLTVALFLSLIPLTACTGQYATSRLLSPQAIAAISRIDIISPSVSYPVTLERSAGSWFLRIDDTHRFPVDRARMADMLSSLGARREIKSVIGSDAEAYGIREGESPRVIMSASSGKTLLCLEKGFETAAGDSAYYRNVVTGALFRSSPVIEGMFDAKTSHWADLTPFAELFGQKSIERMTYRQGERVVVVTRATSAARCDEFYDILASTTCVDVTNRPRVIDESIELEFGDLTRQTIALAGINGVYASIRDEGAARTWIITERNRKALVSFFD